MRILVTAGPTREHLDPVRYISNRSSGKMGYAIADVARERGHEVVLVSGPVALPAPAGMLVERVVSADDMLEAVRRHFRTSDALIMAAAVADWRPAERSGQKVKKLESGGELRLVRTPDILCELRAEKGPRVVVGFSAETGDLLAEAKRKCEAKGLDLVVANDVSRTDAGFDVDTNAVTFVMPDGAIREMPLMSKRAVAGHIVEWVESRWVGAQRPDGGVAAPVRPVMPAAESGGERLSRVMGFVCEIDKLKHVFRKTLLMDGSRYENDAEHSWHLAMMAILLAEYANGRGIDIGRVIQMALVHDLVEMDAGDTYCYDDIRNAGKLDRERRAADRIFGLLPDDLAGRLRGLWEEFEERRTPEARFAAALDRVQPLMHNYFTGGVVWRQHGVAQGKVRERNQHVEEGSRALWAYAERLIRQAVEDGLLARDDPGACGK